MARVRLSPVIVVTTAVLVLQTIAMWGISAVFIWDTATMPSTSLGGALFLDVLVVLAAAAMTVAIVMFLRRVAATRSAIVVWQMTVIGIGIASAQGVEPRWDIALALIVPAAVVTIFVLFHRELSRHFDPHA